MTVLAIGVLINSLGVITVAVWLALAARRERRLVAEITELQAVVDLIMVTHGKPAVFASRYDLDVLIDPTNMPPPT